MNYFLRLFNSIVFLLIFCLGVNTANAKPILPTSALTLSTQDQNILRASLPSQTEASDTWIWQGEPLTIGLQLHRETRLLFPEPIQVDVNGDLSTNQLRVINDHNTLYLTALKTFDKTRLYITLKNSGQIIFLDVATFDHEDEKNVPDVIKITAPNNVTPTPKSSSSSLNYFSEVFTTTDSWVQAMRFAWQQLYAPRSILSDNYDYIRTPLHSPFWITGLFYSQSVWVHPIASWAKDDLTITALELRNPYPHQANIDITRDLCGHWRSAMLYPRTVLQPMGNAPADGATLFLISTESFQSVIGECEHGRS